MPTQPESKNRLFQALELANAIYSKPWPYTDPRAFAQGMGTAPSEEAAKYGASFLPGIGDAVGLAQDVDGYVQNPSSLTPFAAMMTLASVAPGVPNRSATRSIPVYRAQTKGRKTVGQWWTVDKNVAEEFQGLWGGPKRVEILTRHISEDELQKFMDAAEKSGKAIPQEKALLFPKEWGR